MSPGAVVAWVSWWWTGGAGVVCADTLLAMADLELTRTSGDRRLYALEGVGTLRLEGIASWKATVRTPTGSWRLARRGLTGRRVEAADLAGTVVGEFEARSIRRGGALRWDAQELALRPASSWRERYALADGDRELALLDVKGWGKRPVKVTVDDPQAIDPGLLLFAVFVTRALAEDAAGATTAATSAAVTAG